MIAMTGGLSPDLLTGRRILVTGGGTGLGLAMGRRFLELGARLVICGRRAEVLAAAAEALAAETGGEVRHRPCDMRNPDAVEALLDWIWNDCGPLDVLVNNAAGQILAQSHRLSHRAVDSVLGTVLHGSAYATLGCGRRWIADGRPGVVLSILTLSAFAGRAFTLPSAMAKAGVLAMTKSLAVEWGPKGIRLVAIAPGAFPTEGASARLNPAGRAAPSAEAGIPLRRVGRHRELADLAAFLVSDLAGFITGEAVVIDGAASLQGGSGMAIGDLLDLGDEAWDAMRSPGRGPGPGPRRGPESGPERG